MTLRERLVSLGREPFLHFLLIGACLFALNAARGGDIDPASRRITVTQDQVSQMVSLWMQTWGRAPTDGEIDGMIRDRVKEEVYYREALRLGLDKDDLVIRRRLRSKMEFLAVSQLENEKPTDAVLQAWLDQHAAAYAIDPAYSLDQIYLGADEKTAAGVLNRLREGADWKRLGEPLAVAASLENDPAADIVRQFGPGFAAALAPLKPGAWSGPVQSGFGYHLVRVRAVTPGARPALAQVRQAVENDWRAATLSSREDRAYQALLDAYDIRIEKPR